MTEESDQLNKVKEDTLKSMDEFFKQIKAIIKMQTNSFKAISKMKSEISELKNELSDIKNELSEIKKVH